jgi:hypothetical protein
MKILPIYHIPENVVPNDGEQTVILPDGKQFDGFHAANGQGYIRLTLPNGRMVWSIILHDGDEENQDA